MGILGKKKKKKETAEELKARLKELEGEPEEEAEELPEEEQEEDIEELPQGPKKKKKAIAKEEPKGKFSLNDEEMALAVNALMNSEEFKVYQQMVIGQRIAEIIEGYNKVIRSKNGEKEEELPTE